MSELIRGRNVRVEVGLTEGSPKTINAISAATEADVGITAHGLATGSVAYFDALVGMTEMDGQAIRVKAGGSPTADNLLAEGIDSTDFEAFTSGFLNPIQTWATLSQATTYQLGGGAPKTEDSGTLLDKRDKVAIMKLAAETVTIDVRALTQANAALAKIRSAALAGDQVVFRITLDDGSQRVFRGDPSLPGESVSQGGLGSGQMTVTVKGQISYLAPL